MPSFSGMRAAFTPSTSNDNWTLNADAAGDLARVRFVTWGGELTASTAYRTRFVRPTSAGTTPSAGATESANPRFSTPSVGFVTGWSAQPTIPATPDALYLTSWNAHGGLGVLVLPPGSEWEVINGLLQGQLSCRNDVGADANGSSYGVSWEE